MRSLHVGGEAIQSSMRLGDPFAPSWGQLLALALIPGCAAGLAWITAQHTVLRTLRRTV